MTGVDFLHRDLLSPDCGRGGHTVKDCAHAIAAYVLKDGVVVKVIACACPHHGARCAMSLPLIGRCGINREAHNWFGLEHPFKEAP